MDQKYRETEDSEGNVIGVPVDAAGNDIERMAETPEPGKADNDSLADMSTVELLHALETPINGVPSVIVRDYVNARRLVKAALLTVFECATKGTP